LSTTRIREIRRVEDRHGRQRADIHQDLAVARRHQHALVGPRQRQAEADHHRAAHRPRHRVDLCAVMRQRGDVARGAGKAGDDEEIIRLADQRRHRLAAVEHEAGGHRRRDIDALRVTHGHLFGLLPNSVQPSHTA
jgi:hypothetical protein